MRTGRKIDVTALRIQISSTPTVYCAAEFSKRARNENVFITRVIEGSKVWVIGSENDLPIAA